MFVFLSGLLLFLGVHSLRMVAPDWRERVLRERGQGIWKGVYTLLSLLGFALLCWGYGLARQPAQMLWIAPAGLRHFSALLVLLGFVLLVAAYIPKNLLKSKLRHPMVLGVLLWSSGHLLANGSLVDVLLFGSFLAWAWACYRVSRQRDIANQVVYPAGKWAPTVVTLVLGLLFGVLFAKYLHPLLIGVAPLG